MGNLVVCLPFYFSPGNSILILTMAGFRKKFFAQLVKNGENTNERLYSHLKQDLLRDVQGKVVEIGPGTGNNLRWLSSQNISWTGIEPNSYFHPYIQKNAAFHGISFSILDKEADNTGLPDNQADIVISTLVFCSVKDPVKVIREVKRILKPGGRFIFIEHVAAPPGSWCRKAQQFLNPLNKWLADGCNCNRETGMIISQAGFSLLDFKDLLIKNVLPMHAPHIAGYAVK